MEYDTVAVEGQSALKSGKYSWTDQQEGDTGGGVECVIRLESLFREQS